LLAGLVDAECDVIPERARRNYRRDFVGCADTNFRALQFTEFLRGCEEVHEACINDLAYFEWVRLCCFGECGRGGRKLRRKKFLNFFFQMTVSQPADPRTGKLPYEYMKFNITNIKI
jgi:hypothetical protein